MCTPRHRVAPAAALTLALAACAYPATEVLVRLDTDAPASRALTVRAQVRAGTATSGPAGEVVLVRGGALGTAVLPGEFAVTPGARPRDGMVTLVLDAELAAGGASEPAVTFRRIARFVFTPRTPTRVTLFLAMACGDATSGCVAPGVASCTVAQRCEEMGLTCGDHGECTPPEVAMVVVTDAGFAADAPAQSPHDADADADADAHADADADAHADADADADAAPDAVATDDVRCDPTPASCLTTQQSCINPCHVQYNICINACPTDSGLRACVDNCRRSQQTCQQPCLGDCVVCANRAGSCTGMPDCSARLFMN